MGRKVQCLLALLLALALCIGFHPAYAADAAAIPDAGDFVVTDAAPDADAETEADAEVEVEAEADADAETDVDTETDTSAETEADAVPEVVAMAIAAGDGAAFGSWMEDSLAELDKWSANGWTNDAAARETIRKLLNSEPLHPQKTGWAELDAEIEKLLAPYPDAYNQMWAAYDWLVNNVTYSWDGYSVQHAPAYDKFTADYLGKLTYPAGLDKSIPDDMANRAYHVLTQKKGVGYDYGIAMAVIARYIGIESYVRNGNFTLEYESEATGDHGWAVLMLGGRAYVFDPQRDARNWDYNGLAGYYFGIPQENAWRYSLSGYETENENRDKELLPMTAPRAGVYTITLNAQGNGTVSGGGTYYIGEKATLTATPGTNMAFVGWYQGETLLSADAAYSFTVSANMEITARFASLRTITVTPSRSGTAAGGGRYANGSAAVLKATPASGHTFQGWYTTDGVLLSNKSTYSHTVTGDITIYAVFSGDRFVDVKNSWYTQDVMDAAAGYVNGTAPFLFAPNREITRAELVALVARLDGVTEDKLGRYPASTFTDVRGKWYEGYANWSAATGIVNGRTATSFAGGANITRAEVAEILIRYLEYKGAPVSDAPVNFADAAQIPAWATAAVGKAQATGIVNGVGENGKIYFKPTANITRAEAVTMLMRAARQCTASWPATIVYGKSGAGRDLTAYRFGSGKNVMVVGFAIHGYEDNWTQDGLALVYTAEQLMKKLEGNNVVDRYNWSVYVLPCMNPDGLYDGYSHNGPGRCTTTYLNSSGQLVKGRGVDLNRSFPAYWTPYSSSRNYNGSRPLAAVEAQALAQFVQDVKGSGTNICIDTHGWMSQIITSNGYSKLYYVFKNRFPGNSWANCNGGRGYFTAYTASLGYASCLFEFPDGLYSLSSFKNSGYCERYCNCIIELLQTYGSSTYLSRPVMESGYYGGLEDLDGN